MVVESLAGKETTREWAEDLTGYVPGRDTWQFAALLGLANLGYKVVDHEAFDPDEFVTDITSTIRKQVGDDAVADKIIAETDLEAEAARVAEGLAHPNVEFINGIPTFDDVRSAVNQGAFVISNVNSRILAGEDGHRGHFVVVEAIESGSVRFENPGLPPASNQVVDIDRFIRAWHDPSPSMANYIAVYPTAVGDVD